MEKQKTLMGGDQTLDNELTISKQSEAYLNETEQWTEFLSIVGFVAIGIIILVVFFASSILSTVPFGQDNNFGGGMALVFSEAYFFMAALYFFSTWYLYKFSKSMREAIQFKKSEELENALRNHKSFFKFIGMFTIIVLAI